MAVCAAFCFPSGFNPAAVGNPLDQIVFSIEKQQAGGDHIDHRRSKGNPQLLGVNGSQVNRQGLFHGVLQENEGLLHHVPVVNEQQDPHRIEDAFA